jgi:restriction endonuclease S subunit
MNKIELRRIAGVRTGFTLRDKIPPGNNGDISVIQPKDIVHGVLNNPSSVSFKEFANLRNHFLREGDILISNKGVRFNIYRHRKDSRPYVASSAFFVISPTEEVLPAFLEWYLTLPATLKVLESYLSYSTIPTLTKKDLERLEVSVPILAVQQKIETIISVVSEEIMVLNELISKKQEHRDSYCNELINH